MLRDLIAQARGGGAQEIEVERERRLRFSKYIQTAFMNRWNLLWFLGAGAFAPLTPVPDVVLAIAAAAEITYLGSLGTHPKFQVYVDAQEVATSTGRPVRFLHSRHLGSHHQILAGKNCSTGFLAPKGRQPRASTDCGRA